MKDLLYDLNYIYYLFSSNDVLFYCSIRTLQRLMKTHGLKRYDNAVSPQQIANALQVYMASYYYNYSRFKITFHCNISNFVAKFRKFVVKFKSSFRI